MSDTRFVGTVAGGVPDTLAGRELAEYLDAFNTGELEVMRAFVADHFAPAVLERQPAEDRAGWEALRYHETRGLILQAIERAGEHEVVALARAVLGDDWLRVTLRIAEEASAISELRVAYTSWPAALPGLRLSEGEIVPELRGYLERLVAADVFSGAVLVARDGEPLFAEAYGLASKAFNVPNRLDTKFNLGSMNKMFTGVAVAQLAERGMLAFDDPVGAHLPDYPNADVARKVTLHHLLTHTSGLGDIFNARFDATRSGLRTVADYLPLFADEPLEFEPGERWRYSNAGFVLLGAVIERVTGRSYFDYVREEIYARAGMADTDAYENDRDVPNLALGYTYFLMKPQPGPEPGLRFGVELGERRNNLFLHVVKGGPAGGGFSTVEDLLRFGVALRSNRLLGPELVEMVLTGKAEIQPGVADKYAYGFHDDRTSGTRIVGHSGGFAGINAQLDIYLDLGYTVAVLANYDPMSALRVAIRLRQLLAPG